MTSYSDLRKQLYSRVSERVERKVRIPLGRIEPTLGPTTDIEIPVDDITWNQIGGVVWNYIYNEISRK